LRLFLYGTLLTEATLARKGGHATLASRGVAASLNGWQRVGLRGSRYPTLRRQRTGCVCGTLLDVPARAFARLAVYEGPRYCLARVVVQTARGKTAAQVWIAPGGTRRPWKE